MPAKVTYEEIRRTIWNQRHEQFESFILDGKKNVPYKLSNFEKDMRVSELVVDPSTQKRKWQTIIDNGLVIPKSGDEPDRIRLIRFSDLMSTNMRDILMVNEREIERDTHTIAHGRACAREGASE